jgi:hypothetical protein
LEAPNLETHRQVARNLSGVQEFFLKMTFEKSFYKVTLKDGKKIVTARE